MPLRKGEELTGNVFHGDTLALSLNGDGSCADGFQRSMPVDVFALICSFLDVLPWRRSKAEDMLSRNRKKERESARIVKHLTESKGVPPEVAARSSLISRDAADFFCAVNVRRTPAECYLMGVDGVIVE